MNNLEELETEILELEKVVCLHERVHDGICEFCQEFLNKYINFTYLDLEGTGRRYGELESYNRSQ
jgi:hypothetical protein